MNAYVTVPDRVDSLRVKKTGQRVVTDWFWGTGNKVRELAMLLMVWNLMCT